MIFRRDAVENIYASSWRTNFILNVSDGEAAFCLASFSYQATASW